MKILFIAPPFYGYHGKIKNQLIEAGNSVQYIADLADEGTSYRLYKYIKVYRNIRQYLFKHRIMKKVITNNYDILFVIRGRLISNTLLEDLAKNSKYSSIYKIMYQWDAVRRFNYLPMVKHFDSIVTFDKTDSIKYNLDYLPLFSIIPPKYSKKMLQTYDILCLMSYSDERVAVLKGILSSNIPNGFRIKIIMYTPLYIYFKKVLKLKLPLSIIKFKKFRDKNYWHLLQSSKSVLDICHTGQTGSTMRTIEGLYIGKKIITNNSHIIQEDFYDPQTAKVFNDYHDIWDLDFINNDTTKVNCKVKSLKEWCGAVLSFAGF